jgi:hypothetical protein
MSSSYPVSDRQPCYGGQATVQHKVTQYHPIGYAGVGGTLAVTKTVISDSMYRNRSMTLGLSLRALVGHLRQRRA